MNKQDITSVAATTGEVLGCRDLHVTFQDGHRSLEVLCGVNLSVNKGEMVAIVGASGSGKTTLLHNLGLLDQPTSGEVRVLGKSTVRLTDALRTRLRNQSLGYVYQFHHLLPDFSAVENAAMPLLLRNGSKKDSLEQSAHLLGLLGLSERLQHYPSELSGGERQRVALARALITRPVCVLADEPTGNLDEENAQEVLLHFQKIRDEMGIAFVIITHDMKLAEQCDRTLRMEHGVLHAYVAR